MPPWLERTCGPAVAYQMIIPVFGMLGGLLGVALFKRRHPPPPPGTVILPPESPPPGSPPPSVPPKPPHRSAPAPRSRVGARPTGFRTPNRNFFWTTVRPADPPPAGGGRA